MSEAARELLVNASGLTKTFGEEPVAVHALRGVELQIHSGEFVALVGPSGSGKTTLLNLIGALDRQSSGALVVLGHSLDQCTKRERAALRLHGIGFVFQAYNLIPVLTAQENVEFVLELRGVGARERRARARQVLQELGLADLAERRPSAMSGGQQQRVAVARSVAGQPRLVLADEPTANLDGDNAEALMTMMRRLRDERGMTFVFSTHDSRVVAHAGRVVHLRDGLIEHDERKDDECLRGRAGNREFDALRTRTNGC